MTHTITVLALARHARELAQQWSDRKAACTYTRFDDEENLKPNCIVGTAAYELGITLDQLYSINTCGIRHLVYNDVPAWLDCSAEDAEPVIKWLGSLQNHQDSGHTWGEALAYADRWIVLDTFNI